MVASHISLCSILWLDSSAMWIPSASENASAIATVKIPPMTANLRPVPVFNPIITPSVVIIPEVNPNDIPLFIDSFIKFYILGIY